MSYLSKFSSIYRPSDYKDPVKAKAETLNQCFQVRPETDGNLLQFSVDKRTLVTKFNSRYLVVKGNLLHFQGRLHESLISDNFTCTLSQNDVVSLGNRASFP